MKPTFLSGGKPLLTAMVQAETPEEAACTITDSLYDGAEAFGIQLCALLPKYRTEETLRGIFAACCGRPIYITSYRYRYSADLTDDERAELLLLGLRSGATLLDVMGDLFHPEPMELTYVPEAVEKQRRLIGQIHDLGGEALISSHLHCFQGEEEILAIAREQLARGADIAKIVSFAQTEEQLMADLAITHRLKEELGGPFLFLANGPCCRLLRQIGPLLGSCMYLCVDRCLPGGSREQPRLAAARAVRENLLL